MKKFVQNIWMRLLACILCAVSLCGLVVSLAGLLLYAEVSEEEMLTAGNERLMLNYALYTLDNLGSKDLDKLLAETNMYISIEQGEYESNEATEPIISPVYSNMPQGVEPTYTVEKIFQESVRFYNTGSLLKAFENVYYPEFQEYTVTVPIDGYVFDVNTGRFYYQTSVGYFEADYVYVCKDGLSYDYHLIVKNGVECYYNSYYGLVLDTTEYNEWDWVKLAGKKVGLSEEYGGKCIQLITDSTEIEEELRTENFSADYYYIEYISRQYAFYNIHMAVAESLTQDDLFSEWFYFVDWIYDYQDDVVGILWFCFILFIIGVVLLVVSAPEKQEKLKFFHRIPFIIFTGIAFAVEALLVAGIYLLTSICTYSSNVIVTLDSYIIQLLNIIAVIVFVFFVYLANIITRIKTKTFFRYSEFYYISRPIVGIYHIARERASLFWKGIVTLVLLSLFQLWVMVCFQWEPDIQLGFFCLYKLIEIPLVLYVLFQMKQLQEGSKRIASGDLTPIDTGKMFWEFKKHGENINKVREGIYLAVEEQMKSERFRTELITNVSHDIKTPLTSIINYVDLIKKEEFTDPTMVEYVDVLDRQSARLKKLIEDLMEASKASTGNLEVLLEECDMDVMLLQVVGEFEEKLAANNLEVVINKPEEPVKVMVDGRHMWRVLDNLLNNACKYSQPATRVYISLEQDEKEATITFRNVSKMALNIPSEQLLQRFVRGDSSRHTEGSGLGLSIAQSLMELMNGSMKLDIDGDLFKVTLKFNTIV